MDARQILVALIDGGPKEVPAKGINETVAITQHAEVMQVRPWRDRDWHDQHGKAGSLVNDIEEAVSWSGPAVIILFTLGLSDSWLQEDDFTAAAMTPDRVKRYPLDPDPEGQRGIFQEYDLTFDNIDCDFVPYLRECLRKASTNAEGIAWLGFEGSFHYDNLLTDEVADSIYGYCIPDGAPVAIWDDEILKSDRWKHEIAEVRAVLERDFPMPQGD